jgi:uncharacterized membrane protein YgcG
MKHTRRLIRLLLGLVALIMLLLGSTSRGSAQANCDEILVDAAEVFSDAAPLEAIADRLSLQGADAYIRTIKSSGTAGDLDAYAEQLIRECAAWRDENGDRKENLLLVMIAVDDRKTGIYYGKQWNNALDDQWLQIQQTEMNPRFREGDFTGGFVAGLEAIEQRIQPTALPTPIQEAALLATPQATTAAATPTVQATTIALIQPEPRTAQPATIVESVQRSPLPGISLFAAGAVCSASGYGLYRYLQERKRRQTAQQSSSSSSFSSSDSSSSSSSSSGGGGSSSW